MKKICEIVRLELPGLITGEAVAPEHHRHLLACPECHALAEEYRAMIESIKKSDRAQSAAPDWVAFTVSLQSKLASQRKWHFHPALASAFAAAAILATCGILLFSQHGAKEPFVSSPNYQSLVQNEDKILGIVSDYSSVVNYFYDSPDIAVSLDQTESDELDSLYNEVTAQTDLEGQIEQLTREQRRDLVINVWKSV